MEIAIAIGGALLIALAVVIWHVYGDKIVSYFREGPKKVVEESISSEIDKMHTAKADFHKLADRIESRLTAARADVAASTSKVLAAAAPKTEA